MKTTVEIADPLFRSARKHCADHGISFRELLEKGLRATLDSPKTTGPFKLKPFGFQGEGQLVQDWSAIRELAYEGRGAVVAAGPKSKRKKR